MGTRLFRRSEAVEIMDGEAVPFEEYRAYLADLARVNTATLAHRPILRWLDDAVRTVPPEVPLTILDVGYGHGDLLRRIRRWGIARGRTLDLIGIDIDPASEVIAQDATPAGDAIDYRTGDVLRFEPGRSIDYVLCSQTAHHFSDADLVMLVRWVERVAMRGWFIADLHRHALAFHGFPILARLAGWHRFVRHDGPISIARGFRRADWERILRDAGLDRSLATIRWRVPFRLCVGRLRGSSTTSGQLQEQFHSRDLLA